INPPLVTLSNRYTCSLYLLAAFNSLQSVWLVSVTATRLSPKRFSSVWSTKTTFGDDDDVQHEVLLWMRQQTKEFYAAGIGALRKRWDKCINIGGD
ncbi:hypothetical protein AVEN_4682-1, partial [Araneus ventricosus]